MHPPQDIVEDSTAASVRVCLGCDYSLQGLSEDRRCPECGLRNIPQGYREQVWELVDRGKWFFSRAFSPWKKRPAGWWWALDRPGDVGKSIRFAGKRIAFAVVLIMAVAFVSGSYEVYVTSTCRFMDKDGKVFGRPTQWWMIVRGPGGISGSRIADLPSYAAL